jgi:hypothetical protein
MKKYYLIGINKGDMNNMGYYYKNIKEKYDLMKKYYLMAIDKNCYYTDIEKNYCMMSKYLLMAIKNGDSTAMYNLAYYYEFNELNFYLMEKYYLMAIDDDALDNLLSYYDSNNLFN